MAHDATRVLLGTTPWSAKDVSSFKDDPAAFPAGVAVRRDADGSLSTVKSDGGLVGISLGPSLSDDKKTAVLRAGSQVPLRLTDGFAPTVGSNVWIDDVTGLGNIMDSGGVTTTVTNAYYVTSVLLGVNEDHSTVPVALIDMPGGL